MRCIGMLIIATLGEQYDEIFHNIGLIVLVRQKGRTMRRERDTRQWNIKIISWLDDN